MTRSDGEYIKKEDTIECLNDLFGEIYHVSFGNVLQSIDSLQTYSFPDSAENKGDLISRQAVLDELGKWDWQDLYLPIHFKQILDDIPSVENKGEWIPIVDSYYEDGRERESHWECSKCGSSRSGWGEFKFCPDCGADMRGDKADESSTVEETIQEDPRKEPEHHGRQEESSQVYQVIHAGSLRSGKASE